MHVALSDGGNCLVVDDGKDALSRDAEIGLAADTGNLHYFDGQGLRTN